MSHIEIIYTLDDTTAGNYTYDSDKIEFTSSGAKLKLVDFVAQIFNQPYTSDSGFTYDSALTEFVAGKCQQKDQQPNADAAADYSSSIDLSWGGGSLTGAATGGASVVAGELDLAHDDLRYVDYSATGNADSTQVGAVKLIFRPNYSGTPSTAQVETHLGESGNHNNQISFAHIVGSGKIRVSFYNTAGVLISINDLGVFNPTVGVEYEFELNWDLTTGASRFFIDGVQSGLTITSTGTRNAASIIRIGSNFDASLNSNFKVDDIIFYPTVQHTANYTPGYDVWKYKEDLITLPNFSYSGLGTLQAFSTFSTTQVGAMRMNVNSEYWTGSAWAASDDSYAQMNDAATINTNISTLTPSDTVAIKHRSTDQNGTMQSIDDLTVTYTGQKYPTDNPAVEITTGVLADALYSWAETDVTTPAGTNLKYILPRTPDIWWSGSSWVASNETYVQSNTQTDIAANLATLDISVGNTLKFLAFLNSDGTATPIIKQLTMDFDFYKISPFPSHTIVYGQSISMEPLALADTVVTINSYNSFMHGDNAVMLEETATTSADGTFDMDVIETETVNEKVFVKLEHTEGTETTLVIYDNVIIPDVDSVSLGTLLAGKKPRG